MLRSWRAISWRPLRRRLCAAVTLLAYLLAALGLPLPAPARKTEGVPFPCQDHPCGCGTAEQCWSACCCFTPEQRWAWAREHHIQPPAYAEKPSGHGWCTTRARDRARPAAQTSTSCRECARAPGASKRPEPAKPCCTANPGRPPCCQDVQPHTAPEQAPAVCCQKPHDGPNCKPSASPSSREAKPARKGGVRWGLGVAALRCQGLSTLWATTGAAVPAEPPLRWGPSNPAGAWLSCHAESADSHASPPADPPPRFPSA